MMITTSPRDPGAPSGVADRAQELFQEQRRGVYRHTDRLFAGLMIFQWLAGIALSLWSSNNPEERARLAVFLGAMVITLPCVLATLWPGRLFTRHALAAGQMLLTVLLIHLSGDRSEGRFHALGSLALLSFYRDWRVLMTASGVAVAHSLLGGPAGPGLQHLAWIAFEDIFLVRACVLGVREMREAAARQAETEHSCRRHYQELVNSVDGVVWEADAETLRFLLVSPQAARLLGFPVEDWLRDPAFWPDHIDPEDRSWVFRRCLEEASARRPFDIEYRLRNAAGRSVWVRHAVTVVAEQDGRTVLRGMFTDITERRRVERMKNEFVSVVSHELRTPLTAIHGSLGLLAGGVVGELPCRGKALVDVAYRSSDRLVRLVNDILDINKMETGALSMSLKPLELMPLVEQSCEANRAFGEKYGVRFEIASSVPGARVRGDADRLIQVLTNLLSNAAKFSPRNSAVTLSVERRGESLRLSVRDRGPGIPEEFRARIFQKFAQADMTAVRKVGGSGLGLNIAKAIVERHGGKIGFETALNEGTTFFFELPEFRLASAPAPRIPAEPRATKAVALLNAPRLSEELA